MSKVEKCIVGVGFLIIVLLTFWGCSDQNTTKTTVDGETFTIKRYTSTEGVNDDIVVLSQQTIDNKYLLTIIQYLMYIKDADIPAFIQAVEELTVNE